MNTLDLFLHCLEHRRDYKSIEMLDYRLWDMVQSYHQYVLYTYKENKAKGRLASDAWPEVSVENGLLFLGLKRNDLRYLKHSDVYRAAISVLYASYLRLHPIYK